MIRYRLTFHVLTTDQETAFAAVGEIARIVEERYSVEEQTADVRRRMGLTVGIVVFHAERDVEADLVTRALRSVPGIPPTDSFRVKRLGR